VSRTAGLMAWNYAGAARSPQCRAVPSGTAVTHLAVSLSLRHEVLFGCF
jgi:hypothetical protein